MISNPITQMSFNDTEVMFLFDLMANYADSESFFS